jgi:hypothetical protein
MFGDCDTIALSYVVLKIGWPQLTLPEPARPLFGWASQRWNGIGEAVEAEFLRAERTLTLSHAHRRTAIASYDGRHEISDRAGRVCRRLGFGGSVSAARCLQPAGGLGRPWLGGRCAEE